MGKQIHKEAIRILREAEASNDMNNREASVEVHAGESGELIIKLNSVAAVELCRSIMELVDADIDGKHQHFDQFNFVDEGSGKFAIVYCK